MDIQELPGCCGVRNLTFISDVSDPEQVILKMLARAGTYDWDGAWTSEPFGWTGEDRGHSRDIMFQVIFTAVVKSGRSKPQYGPELVKYIEEHNFGTVVASAPAKNPHHPTHQIVVYVWQPNPATLWPWFQEKIKTVQKRAVTRNYY